MAASFQLVIDSADPVARWALARTASSIPPGAARLLDDSA
jgi:hypothetical protein